MEKQQLIQQLNRKKLGLLLSDARNALLKDPESCARAMGVSLAVYGEYEAGNKSPSLPQLELFAYYLNIPIDHFWDQAALKAKEIWEPTKMQQRLQIRYRIIATRLRQVRQQNNLSLEEVANQAGISVDRLTEFESGMHPIPLVELEQICTVLNLGIGSFFDQSGLIGEWHQNQAIQKKISSFSEEFRAFITVPGNQPYLDLAKRISELPVEKLRSIAEIILHLTSQSSR